MSQPEQEAPADRRGRRAGVPAGREGLAFWRVAAMFEIGKLRDDTTYGGMIREYKKAPEGA